MKGLTYDSRALIAAERSERKMWALHKRALDRGVRPSVPAAALTEVYRSARQVNLSQMLAGCRIDPLEEATAKAAGELLGSARSIREPLTLPSRRAPCAGGTRS